MNAALACYDVPPAYKLSTCAPEISDGVDTAVASFARLDTWQERAAAVETWFAACLPSIQAGDRDTQIGAAVQARVALTAILERLPVLDVRDLDAAMLFFMSARTGWRVTAAEHPGMADADAVAAWAAKHPACNTVLAITTFTKQ